MNRDLRDPKLLGETLLMFSEVTGLPIGKFFRDFELSAPDYSANPSCIEKYGRPQDLPSTLPN